MMQVKVVSNAYIMSFHSVAPQISIVVCNLRYMHLPVECFTMHISYDVLYQGYWSIVQD